MNQPRLWRNESRQFRPDGREQVSRGTALAIETHQSAASRLGLPHRRLRDTHPTHRLPVRRPSRSRSLCRTLLFRDHGDQPAYGLSGYRGDGRSVSLEQGGAGEQPTTKLAARKKAA